MHNNILTVPYDVNSNQVLCVVAIELKHAKKLQEYIETLSPELQTHLAFYTRRVEFLEAREKEIEAYIKALPK